ncbi:MAG: hypothetical protein DRN28_05445 [Thermoplasmata archaeon]|nr:MAG: hypothetical protein DRN28_05445 [Thermoplasmata archaeon]
MIYSSLLKKKRLRCILLSHMGLIMGIMIPSIIKVHTKIWYFLLCFFIFTFPLLYATKTHYENLAKKRKSYFSVPIWLILESIVVLLSGFITTMSYFVFHYYFHIVKFLAFLIVVFLYLIHLSFILITINEKNKKWDIPPQQIPLSEVRCPFCGKLIDLSKIPSQTFKCPYCNKKLKITGIL